MFETVSWRQPDRQPIPLIVEVREFNGDIEFDTSALIEIDHLIRRDRTVYRVYEVLGYGDEGKLPPFTVRCEKNKSQGGYCEENLSPKRR